LFDRGQIAESRGRNTCRQSSRHSSAFQFQTEILKLLVAQLSQRNPDEAFIKSREALETLFQEDEDGNACMEPLSILNMIKARNYNLSRPPHDPNVGLMAVGSKLC
jgi:hypothetical protein